MVSLNYPLSFFVRPGKTMLGLDKSEAFSFVVPKSYASRIMEDANMGKSGIIGITIEMDGRSFPAEFRWTTQDGSKPYKRGISRKWGDGRKVLFIQFGASRFKETQNALRALLPRSTERILRGQRPEGETLLVHIDERLVVRFDTI